MRTHLQELSGYTACGLDTQRVTGGLNVACSASNTYLPCFILRQVFD